MKSSDYDKLPKDLQDKIRLSQEAFAIATQVETQLNERFRINDLAVAATMQKVFSVSGVVGSESEIKEIAGFLHKTMPDWQLVMEMQVGSE